MHTFQRMSYARAVKAKPVHLHLLHSAAETELGRKLNGSEVELLDERFSLNNVENCIEKVKLSNVFDNVHVTLFVLQYGYGSVKFLLMLCEKSDYKCFFSQTATPRDGNCLIHGKKLHL